jgi:hypothetical protein
MKNLILLFSLITLFSCSTEEPCEPFPILAIVDATDLTDVSANISGSIILPTCEGTVTSQGFVYSKTTLPKIDDLVIEKAGTNISAIITNLEQNTTYYIRTFFENPTGIYYSNQMNFKTLVGEANINISDAYQIRANSSSIDVSISNLGGGSVLEKGIVYGINSNPTIDDNKIEDSSTDVSFTIDISDLTQDVTYYVKGFVTNEVGTFYSDEISFITENGIASVQIDDVNTITTEGVIIDSRILSDGGSEITERGVVWSLSENPTIDDNKSVSSDSEDTFSNVLSNLNHLTNHYVRSYVTNSIGTYYSADSDFTTLDIDTDSDGSTDSNDNCPTISNPNQEDFDNDGIGNVCDDSDNDGIMDSDDNCKNTPNPNQEDIDNDGIGDVCDDDNDNDGLNDDADNCPSISNQDQLDTDGDGVGNECDDDDDGDGILDTNDNCPLVSNPNQEDFDNDGIGDVCDDSDGDGILDVNDNCPTLKNPNQEDTDGDGFGDYCDDDSLFYVPDDAFERYLEGEFYNNDDYVISHYTKNIKELGTVDDIWSGGEYLNFASSQQQGIGVKNFTGIESLINLEQINLRIESISSIDLSKNKKLKKIRIYSFGYDPGPDLTSIIFPTNNSIEILNLYSSIKDYQFDKFNNLLKLSIGGNARIENLDISNLTSLTFLQTNFFEMDFYNSFEGGILNTPDLSNNTQLETLIIQEAQFETIDLSMLYNLTKADFNTWDVLKLRCIKVNQETYSRIQNQNGNWWFGYSGDGTTNPPPSFNTTITTGVCN